MSACAACEEFPEPFESHDPDHYRDLARELIERVAAGALIPIYASCRLEEILDPMWPGDTLFHDFRCAACDKLYRLYADTYHGSVSWQEIESSETPPFRRLTPEA